jgi:hypothetical protein
VTDAKGEPTHVEKWLREQQEWQRTFLAYIDSMVKNDEFLVNLGNAMRGSLLAGKAYPTAADATPPSETDERLDKVLFALNVLQGQLQDLFMSIEEIRKAVTTSASPVRLKPDPTKPSRVRLKPDPAKQLKPDTGRQKRTRKARA